MDPATGRIITDLENTGLIRNTLIMFSSDNGSYRQASNGDPRAVKRFLQDGVSGFQDYSDGMEIFRKAKRSKHLQAWLIFPESGLNPSKVLVRYDPTVLHGPYLSVDESSILNIAVFAMIQPFYMGLIYFTG